MYMNLDWLQKTKSCWPLHHVLTIKGMVIGLKHNVFM